MTGLRYGFALALAVALLAPAPVLARRAAAPRVTDEEACKAFEEMKQMEKEASSSARTQEEKDANRKKQAEEFGKRVHEENQSGIKLGEENRKLEAAETAKKVAEDDKKKKDDEKKKADEAFEQAKKKVTDQQARIDRLKAQQRRNANIAAAQEAQRLEGEMPALRDAQDKAEEAKGKAEEAQKKAEEELKKKTDEHKKQQEAQKKQQEDFDKKKKAREDQNKKVEEANQQTVLSSDRRSRSLNAWLNKYRDLGVKGQRCSRYNPSDLGLALTMTRWNTGQNLLSGALGRRQLADNQRDIFTRRRPETPGGPGETRTPAERIRLLSGFENGNGYKLPPTLMRNLTARMKEADDAYKKYLDTQRARQRPVPLPPRRPINDGRVVVANNDADGGAASFVFSPTWDR